jgi:hypothetical protein
VRCPELRIDMFELVNHLRPQIVHARVDARNIIGDRLEPAFDLLAQFGERRLLRHIRALYYDTAYSQSEFSSEI